MNGITQPASRSSVAATRRNRSLTHADKANPERFAASSNARFSEADNRSWRSSLFGEAEPPRFGVRLVAMPEA